MIKKLKNILIDNDKKEILTKGFSFLVLRVGGLLAGFLFTYFIAREYGASVVGLVSLSFTLIMCLSIFGRLGVDVNLIPFYSNHSNKDDFGLFFKVLLKAFLFSSFLGLTLYFFKEFIALKLFSKPQLEPYIFWATLTIPLWTVTLVCAGLFRAHKKNTLFAFFNNPGRFIASLIAILLLFICCKDDALTAIKAHFYGVLLISVTSVFIAFRQFDNIKIRSNSNSWHFLRQAFPMMLSGVILVFLGWADTFVLGIYESNETIGIYNVALKIATLTSFSLQAINSILAPKLAKFFNDNNDIEFKKIVRFSTRINFFITLLVVILIFISHKFILGLYGTEFLAGSAVLLILCFGQLINSLSGSVGVILQMIGKQKLYQNIVIFALVLNIVLNIILTPIYGGVGAAIATAISMSSWNIIGAYYLKKNCNITSYFSLKKNHES